MKYKRTIQVSCEDGYSWVTSVNGTHEEITKYFIGRMFDVGSYPQEKFKKCVGIKFL